VSEPKSEQQKRGGTGWAASVKRLIRVLLGPLTVCDLIPPDLLNHNVKFRCNVRLGFTLLALTGDGQAELRASTEAKLGSV
jgi:hypothetical protein